MKNLVIVLLCALVSFQLAAQKKFKFGKVSLEEVSKEKSEISEGAHAEVLAEYGYLRFRYDVDRGLYYSLDYTKRIKIYDEAGYDYADVSIGYYDGEGAAKESIKSTRANVFNLENGKIERTKVSGSNFIDEKITSTVKVKKITFPKVKSGSVIEYTFSKTSDYLSNLEEWTFQEDIPIVWSEYTVQIPEWFTFDNVSQGSLPYAIYETQKVSDGDPRGLNWQSTQSRWAVSNAAPLKDEPFITSKDNFASKINFQMLTFQPPGGRIQKISGDYNDFNNKLLRASSFGAVLDKRNFISETVQSLTNNLSEDYEKALAIYTYVRNEISQEEYTGIYPRNIKKAWKEKKGSVAQINFLLIMMLKEAGLQADPVILSRRESGILHPIYLNQNKFNYLIGHLRVQDRSFLLDASAKGYPFGTLPVRCLNDKGYVISSTSPGWINLKTGVKAENATQIRLNLEENGVLSGTMKVTTKGYSDIGRRIKLYNDGEEKYNEELNEKMLFWEVDSLTVENQDNVYKPLVTKCTISNVENEDSDVIYLNPVIAGQFEKNPFNADNRQMPIDFPYATKNSYYMEINIPDGYQVAELPKPSVIQLPDKGAIFQFSSAQAGNKLTIVNNLKINQLFYTPDQYSNIKQFYEMMINKHSEQIVLKKI